MWTNLWLSQPAARDVVSRSYADVGIEGVVEVNSPGRAELMNDVIMLVGKVVLSRFHLPFAGSYHAE